MNQRFGNPGPGSEVNVAPILRGRPSTPEPSPTRYMRRRRLLNECAHSVCECAHSVCTCLVPAQSPLGAYSRDHCKEATDITEVHCDMEDQTCS
jgi:hypothetical protein